MKQLKAPVVQRSDSRELQPASARAKPIATYRSTNLPPIKNELTDVTIPRQVWSSWAPSGGDRQLRRALTAQERSALELRRNEVAPAIAPYPRQDLDRVALALSDMFGGYTSMRQTDDEAVAKMDSVCRVLADYPAWAIEKAAKSIQTNGVWRDGKFDRRWPPNDSEIVAEVRAQARLYAQTHQNITALLAATVED